MIKIKNLCMAKNVQKSKETYGKSIYKKYVTDKRANNH